MTDGFVDAVLASPVGLALSARLEGRAVHPNGHGRVAGSTPAAVAAAVDAVECMSFGALVELAVQAGLLDAGP